MGAEARERSGAAAPAPWWARPDAATVRPVALPERGAALMRPPVEEEAPDFIREALQRDRNVVNGLPAGWPGV